MAIEEDGAEVCACPKARAKTHTETKRNVTKLRFILCLLNVFGRSTTTLVTRAATRKCSGSGRKNKNANEFYLGGNSETSECRTPV